MRKTFLVIAVCSLFAAQNIASAQITDADRMAAERERLNAVYGYYMGNGGALVRQQALYYLYTNQTSTYTPTTAVPYFQNAYFGDLLSRPDFREQVERVDQFWRQVQTQYAGRELQLLGSAAPSGGPADRLSKIVWLDSLTLTVRIGESSSATPASPNTTTSNPSTLSGTSGYSNTVSSLINNIRNALNQGLSSFGSASSNSSYTQVSSGATTGTGSTQTQTTTSTGTNSTTSLQAQINQLLSLVQSLMTQLTTVNQVTGSVSTNTGTTGGTTSGGSATNTGPTPGTGGGNCSIVGTPLSDGMTVVATVGNLNNAVPVTDSKVTAGASIYMFSPIVEQYDGWAKVSVNGVDYPVAGPGTPPVGSLPYSTSGQNHSAFNRFDIIVPNLPVTDGSDMTIKLFRMNGDQTPYIVKKTFKYHSSLTPALSDPFILPNANLGQNYSAPLTAKCGGSIVWQLPILSGTIPKGFNISGNNLTYNPIGNYVTPQVGDVGTFFLLGKSGSNDVVQKFSVRVVSPSYSSSTGTTNTGNSDQTQTGFPTVTLISPNNSNVVSLYAGKTILISGQNFSSSARVDFYQGTAYRGSGGNVSVVGSSIIQATVPTTLQPGSYTVQVTIGNTVATSVDPSIRTFTINP